MEIDKARTAVLALDFQNDVMRDVQVEAADELLRRTRAVLDAARQAGVPVIHVKLEFRPGYPEVSPNRKSFRALMAAGKLLEGTPGPAFRPEVAPLAGEIVVVKRRASSFFGTDLATILQTKKIDTLVMFGMFTSGVVLSTVFTAADSDYNIVVIEDCCADGSKETHQFLCEKLITRHATVTTAADFAKALSRSTISGATA